MLTQLLILFKWINMFKKNCKMVAWVKSMKEKRLVIFKLIKSQRVF